MANQDFYGHINVALTVVVIAAIVAAIGLGFFRYYNGKQNKLTDGQLSSEEFIELGYGFMNKKRNTLYIHPETNGEKFVLTLRFKILDTPKFKGYESLKNASLILSFNSSLNHNAERFSDKNYRVFRNYIKKNGCGWLLVWFC